MDLPTALEATTPWRTYTIGAGAVITIMIAFWVPARLKQSETLGRAGYSLACLAILVTGFTGLLTQRHDQVDAIATYLQVEHHLTATDPIERWGDNRAVTHVVTAAGDIRWADITWINPGDIRGNDERSADVDPVTVGLTDLKPHRY